MTQLRTIAPAALLILAAACQKGADPVAATDATSAAAGSDAVPSAFPSDDYGVTEDHTVAIGPDPYAATPSGGAVPAGTPIAAALTRAEWAKAANRAHCAPLAFTDDGGTAGTARRANFGGGWAVAFDTPGQRSAYGVAGVGALPEDELPFAQRRSSLAATWPYAWASNDKGKLPPAAYAGFGIEGRGAYSASNPEGRGIKSVAYLIVPGQRCLYNVWTMRGRAHMERLLGGLTVIKP